MNESDFYGMALGAMEELAGDITTSKKERREKLVKLADELNILIEALTENEAGVDEP